MIGWAELGKGGHQGTVIGRADFGCERHRDKAGGWGGAGVNSHSLNTEAVLDNLNLPRLQDFCGEK